MKIPLFLAEKSYYYITAFGKLKQLESENASGFISL